MRNRRQCGGKALLRCNLADQAFQMAARSFVDCRLVKLVEVLRGDVAAPQGNPAARSVGGSANREPCRLALIINLPKSRRASAVQCIVTVMNRYHSKTWSNANFVP
jgi:hypothetical protein